MPKPHYRTRLVEKKLKEYMSKYPAVGLVGVKGSGKTRTGTKLTKSQFALLDPRNGYNNKAIAAIFPEMALRGDKPRLIDDYLEGRYINEEIEKTIAKHPEAGQFLLSDSRVDRKGELDSLPIVTIRGLSLFEAKQSNGLVSLKDLCDGVSLEEKKSKPVDLNDILGFILRGGLPLNLGLSEVQAANNQNPYLYSLIEDLETVDDGDRDPRKLRLVLRSLARHESQTLANAEIKEEVYRKDGVNLDIDTVSAYLEAMRSLHMIEEIPSFDPKSSLRIRQRPLRHFVDPFLPVSILHLDKPTLRRDSRLSEQLFACLVERDLLTYADCFDGKLFHYADYRNHHIDAVIALPNGDWAGFNILLTPDYLERSIKNLKLANNAIVRSGGKGARSLGVIIGTLDTAYQRENGVYVVPIAALKD